MTWVDFTILAIIGISAILALFRGFIREALSLATWILAIWLALVFARPAAYFLRSFIQTPSLRLAIAYAGIFILTLVVGVVINHMAGKLVKASGFSGTDRMLGMLFGIGRGIAVVTFLVLLAGFTSMPRDAYWQRSVFVRQFEPLAVLIKNKLPPDMASQIRYEKRSPKERSSTALFYY